MGIKNLNRFIRDNCPNSMKLVSMTELSGKTIAIDISIYMHKYSNDGNLLENIYLMTAIFRKYSVIPLFVFDGKPPTEKKELIEKRKKDKISALNEYNTLKKRLENSSDVTNSDRQEINITMDLLKKQFTHINREQVSRVKKLLDACGTMWVDAPGEADQMCATLVLNNNAWACMSDDMDMFVYGTHRVLRYFSLMNHTAVLYNTEAILNKLSLSKKEFQEICILSGTDYNCSKTNNINDIYEMFSNFKNSHQDNKDFYSWVMKKHPDVIIDYDVLLQIYNMFDIYSEGLNRIKIKQIPINKKELSALLEVEGFFF